jgi:hypothetical protein
VIRLAILALKPVEWWWDWQYQRARAKGKYLRPADDTHAAVTTRQR